MLLLLLLPACTQVTKAMDVKLIRTARGLPWVTFRDKASYTQSKTDKYDAGGWGEWCGDPGGQVSSSLRRVQLRGCRQCAHSPLRPLPFPPSPPTHPRSPIFNPAPAPTPAPLRMNTPPGPPLADAMRYLSYALYPLVGGYAVYALLYKTHKSWYSFVLNSLVGAVYTFGFILMCPQLYLNYKLKSVAHLPW